MSLTFLKLNVMPEFFGQDTMPIALAVDQFVAFGPEHHILVPAPGTMSLNSPKPDPVPIEGTRFILRGGERLSVLEGFEDVINAIEAFGHSVARTCPDEPDEIPL